MKKYKIINENFLNKYFNYLNEFSIMQIDKKTKFVNRTFNKWFADKYFEYIKFELLGYLQSDHGSEEVRIPIRKYCHINNISIKLDGSNKLIIYLTGVDNHIIFNNIEISYNDLLNLQYLEIDKQKYDYLSSLFEDDREDSEYTFYGKYLQNGKMIDEKVLIFAKDRKEAVEKYYKENPNHIMMKYEIK